MRLETCDSGNVGWVLCARREIKLSEKYKRWEARYSAPDYVFGKAPNHFPNASRCCRHRPLPTERGVTASGLRSRRLTCMQSISRHGAGPLARERGVKGIRDPR